MIAVFKQYLWNGWTDLENLFDKKKRWHRGTHGRSLIPFRFMTSSHEQKTTLFFYLSVRHARVRVFFFISLENLGCKISGLLTPFKHFFIFWISAGNGRIWRKSEKRGFLDGQKQTNMAIFVSRPQVSLTISQGSIIFSLIEDMSVMCLSLLINYVGLKGKGL